MSSEDPPMLVGEPVNIPRLGLDPAAPSSIPSVISPAGASARQAFSGVSTPLPAAPVDSLIEACEAGNVSSVRALLAGGASVNVRGIYGGSLARTMQARLIAASDRRVVSSSNGTPLHAAAHARQEEVADLLLSHGADVNAHDVDGRTPLHVAAQRGLARLCVRLCDAGADVAAASKKGWTPLHWAVAAGHSSIVKHLLAAHAPVHAKDSDGKTPLDVAREKEHNECVQLLLRSTSGAGGRSSATSSRDRDGGSIMPRLDFTAAAGVTRSDTAVSPAGGLMGPLSGPLSPTGFASSSSIAPSSARSAVSARSPVTSLPAVLRTPPLSASEAAEALAQRGHTQRTVEDLLHRQGEMIRLIEALQAQLHLVTITASNHEATIQSLAAEVRLLRQQREQSTDVRDAGSGSRAAAGGHPTDAGAATFPPVLSQPWMMPVGRAVMPARPPAAPQ